MRFLAPVVVVALDNDFLVGLGADKFERSRTDRMPRNLITAALRDNADCSVGQIPQQRGESLFQVKNHGEIIWRVDVIDETVDCGLRAANFALKQRIKRPLHVA